MLRFRKLKQTTLTTQITFESDTVEELRSNIALALLTGAYNPLRKHSKGGQPIDYDKLKVFQEKFETLISDVKDEMDINVLEIKEL